MSTEASVAHRLGPALGLALCACGGAVQSGETSRDAQALDAIAAEAVAPDATVADATSSSGDPDAADAASSWRPLVTGDALDGATFAETVRDARADSVIPGDTDAPADATADDGSAGSDSPAIGTNDLPSTAECLTGGHVLWVQGDPGCFWFTGTQRDAIGSSWSVEAEDYYAPTYDGALLEVGPPDAGGAGWMFNFNTMNVKQPMNTGVVYDVLAVNAMTMVGYVRTCTTAYGNFRVDELRAVGGTDGGGIGMLLSFTAAFSVTCDGYPGVLRGCVHF